MNKDTLRAAALVTGGLLIGFGSGYLLATHRLEAKYRDLAEEEITSVKETYSKLRKNVEKPALEELAVVEDEVKEDQENVTLTEKIEELEYVSDDEKIVKTTVTTNVFDRSKAEDNMDTSGVPRELEPEKRSPDKPYVITVDEFMIDKEDYDKITISYFRGDETLADEREQIIDDVDRIVGLENLDKFGLGSKDESIVYVRNERLQTDFEVMHEPGKFSVMILGMDENYTEGAPGGIFRSMKDAGND